MPINDAVYAAYVGHGRLNARNPYIGYFKHAPKMTQPHAMRVLDGQHISPAEYMRAKALRRNVHTGTFHIAPGKYTDLHVMFSQRKRPTKTQVEDAAAATSERDQPMEQSLARHSPRRRRFDSDGNEVQPAEEDAFGQPSAVTVFNGAKAFKTAGSHPNHIRHASTLAQPLASLSERRAADEDDYFTGFYYAGPFNNTQQRATSSAVYQPQVPVAALQLVTTIGRGVVRSVESVTLSQPPIEAAVDGNSTLQTPQQQQEEEENDATRSQPFPDTPAFMIGSPLSDYTDVTRDPTAASLAPSSPRSNHLGAGPAASATALDDAAPHSPSFGGLPSVITIGRVAGMTSLALAHPPGELWPQRSGYTYNVPSNSSGIANVSAPAAYTITTVAPSQRSPVVSSSRRQSALGYVPDFPGLDPGAASAGDLRAGADDEAPYAYQPSATTLLMSWPAGLFSPDSPPSTQNDSFKIDTPGAAVPPSDASNGYLLGPSVNARHTDITLDYDLGPDIGDGGYACVKVATARDPAVAARGQVVVKCVRKRYLCTDEERDSVVREVEIHRMVSHPHCVMLWDAYEDKDFVYLVVERVPGGDLESYIRAKSVRQFTEVQTRLIVDQLLEALDYLHSKGILHADVKPSNILIADSPLDIDWADVSKSADASSMLTGRVSTVPRRPKPAGLATNGAALTTFIDYIKLCDFGAARRSRDARYYRLTGDVGLVPFSTITGTMGYVAPEILGRKHYSTPVDIWSAGIILYELLAGYSPFYPYHECLSQPVSFAAPQWETISPEAKALCAAMLQTDPAKRITVSKARSHPWFTA